jgi:RNA polymerase sigma factor (sigma-70 family)
VSPLTVRRYRAERLLRQEFDGLRRRVIANVRARLRASGAELDRSDLEACYAEAWHGLYTVVLEGQKIANPAGWLTLVTYRRAIEETRSRGSVLRRGVPHGEDARNAREASTPHGSTPHTAEDRDFAAELDDRVRLRQLFEGLRGRLSAREREAASLCYLQGLSRVEAAARMGVSESRMRKLMEGQGAGRPGVAGKVGVLVETIRAGGWCEAQGSLMRGLAYGILDPDGERYRLALLHRDECPACSAYVRSLRGLAAALPPVLLPWGLAAGALARAAAGTHAGAGIGAGVGAGGATGAAGGTGAGAAGGTGAGAAGGTGAGAQAGSGIGGALSASGVASAGGAAGGSWLVAGGTFAGKLAVGCVLALGVGAGCLALSGEPGGAGSPAHGRHVPHDLARRDAQLARSTLYQLPAATFGAQRPVDAPPGGAAPAPGLAPASRASREFGPEQALAPGGSRGASAAGEAVPTARSASTGSDPVTAGSSAGGSGPAAPPAGAGGGQPAERSSAEGLSKAEREFAPG